MKKKTVEPLTCEDVLKAAEAGDRALIGMGGGC